MVTKLTIFIGLNHIDVLENVFHVCIYGCMYLATIVFAWIDICGSQMLASEWVASNLWLDTLLFIVILVSLCTFFYPHSLLYP